MKVLVLPRKTVAQVREDSFSAGFYRNPEFLGQGGRQQTTVEGGPARFRFEERAQWLGGLERISNKGEMWSDDETPSWRVRRFLQEEESTAQTELIYSREPICRIEAIRRDGQTLEERINFRYGNM